jgi:type III restriction enzyme
VPLGPVTPGVTHPPTSRPAAETAPRSTAALVHAALLSLNTVDDPVNPVEWIVSVSMLTEGWDVKNVFQIYPHEKRAFNSKLLIAQVLGRGPRRTCATTPGRWPRRG